MSNKINVLIVGSGGREHAFAWKLNQSPLLNQLFIAPGNPGTAQIGTNLPISVDDFESMAKLVIDYNIKLVLVGPEVPLVKGIKNFFDSRSELKDCIVIGPDQHAAMLEGSKDFAKEFMIKHHIPTAAYKTFDNNNLLEGYAFLESLTPPYVLKADGLAAGKGVIITSNLVEAKETLKSMIADLKFGEASSKVVIEEFLDGIEMSVFALTDGKNYVLLPEAKDYKRIGVGDTGPNTGGMGAVSPVVFADEAFMKVVDETIVKPTIDGLNKDNFDYKGFVFFGLIKVNGIPKVIEYNCRMGDPETEAVLLRLNEDLLEFLIQTGNGTLENKKLNFSTKSVTSIVKVSGGYPEDYQKGDLIEINDLKNQDIVVFHAGTSINEGKLVTNGGRVMVISAIGNTVKEALKLANEQSEHIKWNNAFHRNDIGLDLLDLQ